MSPQDRMRASDALLAEIHAFNIKRISDDAAACSKAELNGLVAGAGLASRRTSGALAASHKGQSDKVEAAIASGLKTLSANENEIDANPEMEMDDDTGRTPERVAQVRAEIERRLALLRDARDSKSLVGKQSVDLGGALLGGVARSGGAPEAST